MTLLVLVSTMSFSIDKHFCGEHLVDVSIFGNAQPCAMEVALEAKYGSEHSKKSECCSNENIVIEGQDELKVQLDQLDTKTITFFKTFTFSYVDLFEEFESDFVTNDGYPPPLITIDYQVLYDQYLI
ncbi:hypothetical protein OD90_1327 [Dokdonia sp. Hel_I_53]|nr:hypothetical protein [Dokdonia sp. Hel_I_53]TVZ52162.1 hypothetical protein OD90_1327 [Dokdonia sp. Hel_I_53]